MSWLSHKNDSFGHIVVLELKWEEKWWENWTGGACDTLQLGSSDILMRTCFGGIPMIEEKFCLLRAIFFHSMCTWVDVQFYPRYLIFEPVLFCIAWDPTLEVMSGGLYYMIGTDSYLCSQWREEGKWEQSQWYNVLITRVRMVQLLTHNSKFRIH